MKQTIGVTALVLTLLAAGCGARLTPGQRAEGIAAGTGRTSSAASGAETEAADSGSQATEETTGAEGAPAAASGGATTTGTRPAGGGQVAGAPARAAAAVDNGGSTDVGITASEITIATIANISGVQPGLFKSAHQAMEAFVAYANSLGPIYGRRLKVLLLDDKTDSGGNRASTLEACQKSFALVGSMSAFDDGGAQAIDQCGIPDMMAISTNASRAQAKLAFPINPNRPDYWAVGPALYLKERFPGSVKKAAQLWLNAAVTRSNAANQKKAYEAVGFEFIYTAEVQILEANYSPYVLEMRRRGVEYVTLFADYQSIVRFLKAMRQQNWDPPVKDWVPVVYSQDFLDLAGPAAEGSLFFLNTQMFEEASGSPELQLYLRWLDRVAPGARPDYFGEFAWSAGRLFLRTLQAIGPKATRAKLVEELKKTHAWDDFGMHGATDIGNKLAADCFVYAQVKDGKFQRLAPDRGFKCDPSGPRKMS